MDPFIVEHGTIGMPGPLTMTPTFTCSPECTTAAPAWDGCAACPLVVEGGVRGVDVTLRLPRT
ncbi:hypothetical protein GCM10010345_84980 [Streptomyces canarius]|uniref:Uncharacterized protein n=1 Tax=Streptomyces canarius TaxID=285453 RepID=A0ABQ3DEV6_9ACTN|nr:hypothetical protein GCM10010345_84980 [Streptomyces canarius]